MVAAQTSSLSDFPAEMLAAGAAEGELLAGWVAQFVHALPPEARPKNMMTFGFLLRLGAALRLLMWESKGFSFHRAAGLPDAHQAIRNAIGALNAPATDPTGFCVPVLRLAIDRFAWNGPRELGADIALGEASEENLLEALADFLWSHRPR